jgi:GTP-binding protein
MVAVPRPQPVSGANGRGSGDLLDKIVSILKKHRLVESKAKESSAPPITLAILGQPNSGKSTLLNAIIGEERVITSPTPHTTREPQDIPFVFKERELILIDTAGIRRKAHVTAGVEQQGVSASLKTVNRADVVILVIDALRGPTVQDQRLASYVIEHGKGLILAINKWDLVADKTAQTMQITTRQLRELLPGLNWVPIIFISAKNKQRVTEMLAMALGAKTSGQLTLSEEMLMDFLKIVVKKHRPTKAGGVRHPKILSLKQVHTDPPRFEVTALGELHPSYLKFLENRLREHFGFTGAPIAITLKTRRKRTKLSHRP